MDGIYRAEVTRESRDRLLFRIAQQQHGVFTRGQARECGISNELLARRVATGSLEQVSRDVFRAAGRRITVFQMFTAAVLAWGEGSAVSHLSAMHLWSLPGGSTDPVEVTVPDGRRRKPIANVLRHYGSPDPEDVTTVHGIPVTTPVRTLIDVAALLPREDLEEALDEALRRRLTSPARLERRLDALAVRGRPGVRPMRALLAERDGAAPDSVLGRRFLRILLAQGFPRPVPQHPVAVDGHMSYVDFAYPDALIAIETDGHRFHSSRKHWKSDRTRRNRLTARGWHVLHVTWEDLSDPAPVLGQIRDLLARMR